MTATVGKGMSSTRALTTSSLPAAARPAWRSRARWPMRWETGARIAVVDRARFGAAPGRDDARAFALSAGSKRLLDVLGVWPADRRARPAGDGDRHHRLQPRRRLPPGARLLRQHRRRRRAGHLHRRAPALARSAPRRGCRAGPCIALLGGAAAEGFAADEHGVTVASRRRRARCARRCWSPPTGAARGCARRPASRSCAGAIRRSASSPPSGTRSRTAAAPCSISCPAGPFAILPLTGNRSCITWTEEASAGARDPGARRCRLPRRGREALRLSAGRRSSWRARAPPGRSTCISPAPW